MKNKIFMTALSDTGLKKDMVIYNDAVSLKHTFEVAGYDPQIVLRENVKDIKGTKDDVLFVLYVGVINFGGQQSVHVVRTINAINRFKGKVVLFFNDIMDKPRNDMRDEFEHVKREIYLANPIDPETAVKSVINFDVVDAVQLNQSWSIGKELVQRKKDETEPMFDLSYGGRDRPKVVKELNYIFSHVDSGVVYNGISKSITAKNVKKLNIKRIVDNSLFREMISLGKYTIIPYEKGKDYVTSRMFETLTSNAITLFNKDMVKVSDLVSDDCIYETADEAIKIINQPYSADLLKKQHELVERFDFDKHIKDEAEAFVEMLKG